MRMALQTTLKKRLQINISHSKCILGITAKGLKLIFFLKAAFGQDKKNNFNSYIVGKA